MSDIITSILTSVIITTLTLNLNRRKEIKAHIYDKREEVYLRAFESFEKLIDNKWKMFQGELAQLKEIKGKIHLYASNQVIENYDKLLDALEEIVKDFRAYDMRKEMEHDPDENAKDEDAITNIIANHEEELGMKVTDLMHSMIQQMRKEMKI